MKVTEFRHHPSGTRVGFVSVALDSGLVLHGVTLHKQGEKRWAGLPGKPMLDRDRNPVLDANGKPRYSPVVEIEDRKRRDAFAAQVWAAAELHIQSLGGAPR